MRLHSVNTGLYRFRYPLGYAFIAALLILTIGLIALAVPGGLRQAEIVSSLQSGALSISQLAPDMVVNWPYHLLQLLSFKLLGVTELSIKLPSLVIGLIMAIGIFVLTKTWFRRNIAIISTSIAVTMSPFLFMIQDGTPLVSFSCLVIWLLVAATYITNKRLFATFWKVVGCILLAVSLYIPLGLYVALAFIAVVVIHPHIRLVIRKTTRLKLTLAVVLGLVSITPLIYASILQPNILLDLLGLSSIGPELDIGANIVNTSQSLFGFSSPSTNFYLQPLFSLTTSLILAVGLYRLLTEKYTAKSYAVLFLGIIIAILAILSPSNVFNFYPVAVILITTGVATLVQYWYKIFPLNPYARLAGLIPLSVLMVGMIFSDLSLYTENYRYNPQILAHFSTDSKLLSGQLASLDEADQSVKLIVADVERPFYNLVARYNPQLSLGSLDDSSPSSRQTMIVTQKAHADSSAQLWELQTVVTSDRQSNADRFYIYQTSSE